MPQCAQAIEEVFRESEQSLWRGQIVRPKTIYSAGILPHGVVLGEILAGHQRQAHQTGPGDFAFCKEDGTPFNPDVLRKDVL